MANIYVRRVAREQFNRLTAVDLTFENQSNKEGASIGYEIDGTDKVNVMKVGEDRYEFNFDGVTQPDSNNPLMAGVQQVQSGTVTFTGAGASKFGVKKSVATNVVHATEEVDSIVKDYVEEPTTASQGTLQVTDISSAKEDSDGIARYDIKPETAGTMVINVLFPNAIEKKSADYTEMKISLHSALDDKYPVEPISFGGDGTTWYNSHTTYKCPYYQVRIASGKLLTNTRYTVTIEGEGYRTYSFDIIIPTKNQASTITLWNNVMDNKIPVVKVNNAEVVGSDENVTFLAGDIIEDNNINLYDLSAAVTHFGNKNDMETTIEDGTLEDKDYIKYDLNRDGVIDSKDIAMVLISWGY